MSSKPKLTAEEWNVAREVWESDSREGYAWLIRQMSLPVTAPAIRKRAMAENWMKPADVAKAKPGIKDVEVEKPDGLPRIKPKPLEEIAPALADGMTFRERAFVEEYQKDNTKTKAGVRAGYKEKTISAATYRLMKKPAITEAIRLIKAERMSRLSEEADMVASQFFAVATADPNELVQYRRVNCRHCWGNGHLYQRTPAEYRNHVKAVLLSKHSKKPPPPEFDEEGGFGFRRNRDPNPECPECCGEGVGEIFVADSRHLSATGKLLWEGVQIGKDGLTVKMASRESARLNMARMFGMLEASDSEEKPIEVDVDTLERQYIERMEKARERQREVLKERGLLIEGESEVQVQEDEPSDIED